MKTKGKHRFGKMATTLVAVAVLLTCVFIMLTRKGLDESKDFGAGAYYYADIPGFEQYFGDTAFSAALPYAVYVILFLAWGLLMYRLWCRLEK